MGTRSGKSRIHADPRITHATAARHPDPLVVSVALARMLQFPHHMQQPTHAREANEWAVPSNL